MCSKGIAKAILIAFNVIFVILGVVCLGLGIFVYIERDDFGGVLSRVPIGDESAKDAVNNPSLLENAAIALMVGGGFIFLLGFMGCCGAVKEWRVFLVVYIIIVTIILLVQIAAGVLAVFFNDTVEEKLLDFLKDTITDEYDTGVRVEGTSLKLGSEPIDLGWDLAQVTFKCCGASNSSDWDAATRWNRAYTGTYMGQSVVINPAQVPLSCCKLSNPEKYPDNLDQLMFVDITNCLLAPNATNANLAGCYEEIKDKLKEYGLILMIVGIVIGCMEIIGVIAAIYLCCKINQEEK